MQGYFGIYWTYPVPWLGFTRFEGVDHAARISRTIRYQRDIIRREVAALHGVLAAEAAFIENAPDRGTPEVAAEIAQAAKARPELVPMLVDFGQVLGWRRHPDLMRLMDDAGAHFAAPDPTFLDGVRFDPAAHFRDWATRWQDHAQRKDSHRQDVLAALAAAPDGGNAALAAYLNGQGLRTHTGKAWSADNLRKFRAKG
ncbi:hypothetical protein [Paracoccus jeotgali]|uniref:hypothetical protein n=1 Tax=Paracoccus jeotgali TaxID=2065379 RepID=UPI0028AB7504|nr:hypothetical protein [Paracoccus jeotgali]